MSFCVVAIFKNESCILTEWINHYLRQGASKLFLIDNDSDDNYFIAKDPRIEIVVDKEKYVQTKSYNKYFLEKSKAFEWVLVCDLDEFVYARKEFQSIAHYLHSMHRHQDISQILIPWKMFGSNGHVEQPASVVKGFSRRLNYDKGIEESGGYQGVGMHGNGKVGLCKSIVRTKHLIEFQIHTHVTRSPVWILSNNRRIRDPENNFCAINETLLQESNLHLNHYAIQSLNWFRQVKATRGDVNNESVKDIRDDDYFYAYDNACKDIVDEELSRK